MAPQLMKQLLADIDDADGFPEQQPSSARGRPTYGTTSPFETRKNSWRNNAGFGDDNSALVTVPDRTPKTTKKGFQSWKCLKHLGKLVVFPKSFRYKTIPILILASLLMVFAYAWLYLGAFWNPHARLKNLPVGIYSADVGFTAIAANSLALLPDILSSQPLGTRFQNDLLSDDSTKNLLKWEVLEDVLLFSDLEALVKRGSYFGIIYFGEDASNNITTYLNFANVPGSSTKASLITFIYDQGRSYFTANVVADIVKTTIANWIHAFKNRVITASASLPTSVKVNSYLYIDGIQLVPVVLQPVSIYGNQLAVLIGPVLLYIGALAVVSITIRHYAWLLLKPMDIRRIASERYKHTEIKPSRVLMSSMLLFAFFSLVHAALIIIVVAVLGVGNSAYPLGYVFGYLWYISLCFHMMHAFFAVLFGVNRFPIVASILLVLMIVSSGSLIDHQLQHPFFLVGRGFPLTYAVQGLKTYFFGSMPERIAENCLIILAYTSVSGVLFAVLGFGSTDRWKPKEDENIMSDLSAGGIALDFVPVT